MAFPDISNHVVWASTGEVIDPGDTKTAQGWIVEAPPYQYYNWWQNRVDEALVVLGSEIDEFQDGLIALSSPAVNMSGTSTFAWNVGGINVSASDSVVLGPPRFGEAMTQIDQSFTFQSYSANSAEIDQSASFIAGVSGSDPVNSRTGRMDRTIAFNLDAYDGSWLRNSALFGAGTWISRADIFRVFMFNTDMEVWDNGLPQIDVQDSAVFNSYLSNLDTVEHSVLFNSEFDGTGGAVISESFIMNDSSSFVTLPSGSITGTFAFHSEDSLRGNTLDNVLFHAGNNTSVEGDRNFVHHIDTSGGLTVSGDLNTVFSSDSTLEDMRVAGDGNVFGAHSGWRHSQVGVEGFIDADQCVILGGRSSVEVDADANNSIALGVTTFKAVATGGPTGPVFAAVSTTAEFENSSNSAILASRISKVTDGLQSVVVGSSYVENNIPNSLAMGYNGSPTTASPNNITIHLFAETGNAEFSGNVTSGAGGNEVVMDAGFMDFTPLIEADRPVHTEGRVYYDAESKSLVYNTDVNEVTVNLGRELQTPVRNVSGATIPNGSVVFATGSSGERITVDLAQADAFATSRIIAVATHDIGNNSNGYTTTFGRVRGLDTSAWPAGTTLYLSSTTPGAFTDTPPAEPAYTVKVATVERSHATIGRILVAIDHQSVDASQVIGNALTDDNVLDDYGIRAPLSVKPTLSLNFAENEYEVYEGISNGFTKKPVADAIDVVRSTIETGVAATGLIEEVAANELPLVFDPDTGESLGAQISREYTNLLLWSEKFDEGVWSKNSATVTSLTGTSVVGGPEWEVECTASGSFNGRVTQDLGVISGWHTAYFLMKKGNTSNGAVTFETSGEGGRRLWVDLETGDIQADVGASGGNFDFEYTVKSFVNGYYLVGISMNISVAGSTSTFAWASDPGVSNATAGNSIVIAAAQVTEGRIPQSYVKTEGSQVTKSSTDTSVENLFDLAPQQDFTLLVDFDILDFEDTGITTRRYVSVNDGASNANRITIAISNIERWVVFYGVDGTFTNISGDQPEALNGRNRVAVKKVGTTLHAVANGESLGSVTNSADWSVPMRLQVGREGGSIGQSTNRGTKIVPRALSDEELIAWTTLRSTT